MKDHLGNVRLVFSDRKTPADLTSYAPYSLEVRSLNNYYSYGSLQTGQSYESGKSRYGFNGKEQDREIKGDGSSYDFGERMYNADYGRWFSIDPLFSKYPGMSPYNAFADNPILFIDIDGRDWIKSTGNRVFWYGGNYGDEKNLLKVFKASSGYKGLDINGKKIDLQYSKNQSIKNGGPTVEGIYKINLKPEPERALNLFFTSDNKLQLGPPLNNEGGIEKLGDKYLFTSEEKSFTVNFLRDWGNYRAMLTPVDVKQPNKSGDQSQDRDLNSFYFHDSQKGYTHGCTEVEGDFFDYLLKYRIDNPKETNIKVMIKYPNKNHNTNENNDKNDKSDGKK